MGLFGKSEDELKQIAAAMDKRQTDFDNRESDIKSGEINLAHQRDLLATDKAKFDTERVDHTGEFKRSAESIAAANADLEKRRSEIVLMEAGAKANFADAQREAFKEVVEARQTKLDARQCDLDALAADVAKRLEALHAKEGDLAKRELAVTEREQKADAGYADKARALADEAARQHRANLAESERLEKLAAQFSIDHQALAEKKGELTHRERAVILAEQSRDQGFVDERAALNAEFRDKRARMEAEIASTREQKLSALEDEMAKLKAGRLENVSQAEQSERDRIRAEIAKEREAWIRQQEDTRRQLETERTELEKQKGAVSSLQNEFQVRTDGLEAAERILERKEQRLERRWKKRDDELNEEVESQLAERRKTLEDKNARLEGELADLREYLGRREKRLGAFEHLEQQLQGKDPDQFIDEIRSKREEVMRLKEESATLRTEEMRVLELQVRNQKTRADQLAQQIASNEADLAEVSELRRKNKQLTEDSAANSRFAENCKAETERLTAELNRLRAAYERPAEVEARYKEIEMPHIKADKVKPPKKAEMDELAWLTGVASACDSYGLHFNPRILKAFHTALKTAEWSPLTVLAGVSGTGKSELPRLYSHFGGLHFEPLSVQPNWDSQESMLGFFNSIDNKFDAQPILRFLAQSQKKWAASTDASEGYPGLDDAVCLVLLDEMNMAHPELYFAEFLSKLELRRGMKGAEVPSLSVKIGAGLPQYQLPLGRNVLWTGTMNQDETTKALSDKVLDRSIVIHFPRPTALKRRLKLTPLDGKNRGPLLHKSSWQSWLTQGSSFSEDDIEPFKTFIEETNAALAIVGRAIGHRVWQSVEYYMANYPDVGAAQKSQDKGALAKALHTAFEDQLVQKVMPKLRGIDTIGKSRKDCLDKILAQINNGISGNRFNLADDFNLACELGYGQFIWQSANYLSEPAAVSVHETVSMPNSGQESSAETAPETSA
ncbi:MAG: chromosome segregation ATPase-like protein [Chthoniobacteraceae bacterium]|nr:chromosome segregation ATPase-like protein [Chthoniobacteraceae bacterium]